MFGQVGQRGFALRGGVSSRAADDLRTGGSVDSHSAIARYLGLPSSTLYDRLPATGYRQSGWSAAGTLPFADGSALTGLAMQDSQQGVSRYDRLLGGDGLFRSEFDPQQLGFGYLRYQRNGHRPVCRAAGDVLDQSAAATTASNRHVRAASTRRKRRARASSATWHRAPCSRGTAMS